MKKKIKAVIVISIMITCLCFASLSHFALKKINTQMHLIELTRKVQDQNRSLQKEQAKRKVLQKEIEELKQQIEQGEGIWSSRVKQIKEIMD